MSNSVAIGICLTLFGGICAPNLINSMKGELEQKSRECESEPID